MREARHLIGEFSSGKGWTARKVDILLSELHNRCLSPYGWHVPVGEGLVGAMCTLEMADYERACLELPHLREMEPEAVCVNYVVEVALKLLPEDRAGILGKSGSVELFFDRNEPFRHMIHRTWNRPYRRRKRVLKLVHNISDADMKICVGLQLADFLAWHTNRDFANQDAGKSDLEAALLRTLTARCVGDHYGVEKLIEHHKDWRS